MKTENLIRALTADAEEKIMSLRRALVLGLLPALAVSAPLYFLILGPRPHLLAMIGEPRIMFKLVFPLALVACAGVTLLRLVRPGSDLRLWGPAAFNSGSTLTLNSIEVLASAAFAGSFQSNSISGRCTA